ncbi:MAG: hypothetical protein HY075_07125, partial [Deltaproteobacteria bacterium]|nr:hypothetical protein [Deltaproteobacteria bacterium]
MDRWHAQENLSHLVNAESLLGKLSRPASQSAEAANAERKLREATPAIPPEAVWPRDVLSLELRERIGNRATAAPAPTPSVASALTTARLTDHLDVRSLTRRQPAASAPAHPQQPAPSPLSMMGPTALVPPRPDFVHEKLRQLLELFTNDVLAARDRLLMLNPGRRKLIEHRLEFIGRKVARARGERFHRSLSLPEILKDSYRDSAPGQPQNPMPKLGLAAWRGFVSEVALYNLLELFFLKSLDVYGWRPFEEGDLGRMNFAAHTFLSQRATGFAHDKHCWNFVRT